jgi:hypothetical protein
VVASQISSQGYKMQLIATKNSDKLDFKIAFRISWKQWQIKFSKQTTYKKDF